MTMSFFTDAKRLLKVCDLDVIERDFMAEFLLTNVELILNQQFSDIHDFEVVLERPLVLNNRIVGFVDLFVSIRSKGDEEAQGYIFFMIRDTAPLVNTLQQIRTIKHLLEVSEDSKEMRCLGCFVFAKDNRYRDAFTSQGIEYLSFEEVRQLATTDSLTDRTGVVEPFECDFNI